MDNWHIAAVLLIMLYMVDNRMTLIANKVIELGNKMNDHLKKISEDKK